MSLSARRPVRLLRGEQEEESLTLLVKQGRKEGTPCNQKVVHILHAKDSPAHNEVTGGVRGRTRQTDTRTHAVERKGEVAA